jgi:5-methylcytosine-specific restriction endonuclease McrBC regulatory subunit McrC
MDKNRWMTADVLLKREAVRWVLDAKYKCGFGDEGRGDRFQMCAYLVGFAAHRATLVYPTGKDKSVNNRVLLDTSISGHSVRVDSVELPMGQGPDACRVAIKALCDEGT